MPRLGFVVLLETLAVDAVVEWEPHCSGFAGIVVDVVVFVVEQELESVFEEVDDGWWL
jgi:hypothetical protein